MYRRFRVADATAISRPATRLRHPSGTADTSADIFVVDRSSLDDARWVVAESVALGEGEVRLRIDAFALTSNNITYAAFGAAMNYWSFFPTGSADTGCIPV